MRSSRATRASTTTPAIKQRSFIVAAASLAFVAVNLVSAETKSGPTDEADRARRFLEERVRRDPDDIIAQNRLAEVYLQRLRETGDYKWLQRAGEAALHSLTSVPAEQNPTGLFMRGRVEYESHHFATARDLASELTKIDPGKSRGFALLGDALLEFGDLDLAATAYDSMEKLKSDSIETETRLARLEMIRGAYDSARQHFDKSLEAARKLSPPSPEIVAWCLVQSGQLAFNLGQWDAAEKDFLAALEQRVDDPGAMEHLAELRAAQEKYADAVALYEKVLTRMPRPEFWQALGDVYAAMGKLADAKNWHGRARDAYLKNAAEGNAHYFHHLAGFFSDTEENPVEALKWARRDLELRHSAAAEDALAWALFRGGDFAQAKQIITKVLARGVKDAHILAHAGMILLAADNTTRGKELLAEAARMNPHHNSFHVHR